MRNAQDNRGVDSIHVIPSVGSNASKIVQPIRLQRGQTVNALSILIEESERASVELKDQVWHHRCVAAIVWSAQGTCWRQGYCFQTQPLLCQKVATYLHGGSISDVARTQIGIGGLAVALCAVTQLVVSGSANVASLRQRALADLVVSAFTVVAHFRVGAHFHHVVGGPTVVAPGVPATHASHASHANGLRTIRALADLVVGALAVVAGLGVGALPDQVVCSATVVASHATHSSSKPAAISTSAPHAPTSSISERASPTSTGSTPSTGSSLGHANITVH